MKKPDDGGHGDLRGGVDGLRDWRYAMPMRRSENPICSVDGCGRKTEAKGMCGKHYKAAKRALLPRQRQPTQPPHPCAAAGCTAITTRTYCNAHEKRLARYGDANYIPPRLNGGPCSVDGCTRTAQSGGMCRHHHHLQIYHGTVKAGRPMLTDEAIEQLRQNPEAKTPQQLAEQYGITLGTVVAVRRGRNWGFLRT